MDIFYLHNSGFSLEIGDDALIVDYYRGEAGRPWRTPLDKNPSDYRNVYVFASHSHGDHYNSVIFKWLAERKDIHYILSSDIKSAAPSAVLRGGASHSVTFLKDGDSARIENLEVKAYGSTDAGVSFHIATADGADIFHAGDLNFWHWKNESTDAEVTEAYDMFMREMEKIRRGIKKLDVAFFPTDTRMGEDYYRGAVIFCEMMKPTYMVPMHFSTVSMPRDFISELSPHTKVVHTGPTPTRLNI